jgi:hypothetical protein
MSSVRHTPPVSVNQTRFGSAGSITIADGPSANSLLGSHGTEEVALTFQKVQLAPPFVERYQP